MIRPCFLVIDREHSGAISTRKLVIETAKMNVITAYSTDEALETLGKFPAVDGVVMDVRQQHGSCADVVRSLREINPVLTVIAVAGPGTDRDCEGADHVLQSFDPKRLLDILESLKPREMADIKRRDAELASEEQDERSGSDSR